MVAKERAKYPPEVFNAEAEERILNQYTLDYYFDYLGHEVVYRQTPAGPEVVPVGDDERLNLRQRIGGEEYEKFKTRLFIEPPCDPDHWQDLVGHGRRTLVGRPEPPFK